MVCACEGGVSVHVCGREGCVVCACEGGVSVHVYGREGCVVCACVGEERVSTHPNSNSLDEDAGICLHNHSGGENTNCHVTHDRTG